MFLSVQRLTDPPRCWLHRSLNVYQCVCTDKQLPCSYAFISLGLVCLHFCSSSLFNFLFPQKSIFSLSFLFCYRGILLGSLKHFVCFWSDDPFCLPAFLGKFTFHFSALLYTRLKGALCAIRQSVLKPEVLLLGDTYQILPLNIKMPLIKTLY